MTPFWLFGHLPRLFSHLTRLFGHLHVNTLMCCFSTFPLWYMFISQINATIKRNSVFIRHDMI